MHELSLARGLIRELGALAARHGARRVVRVRVEIGPFSGVVVDSFRFGFEALAGDDPLMNKALLEIMEPKPSYRCMECGIFSSRPSDTRRICPACGCGTLIPHGGDGLFLLQVEME